jgi:ArsR family transcriptional regulator, arsenate/arsenite/antimonite-responsive transcriptional repressor
MAKKRADEELSLLCKALGHPIRVEIVRILDRRHECGCGDLVDELPVAQSTVSQHLKVLKQAGLILGEVDGARRGYCLNREALARLKALIEEL